MAGHSRLVASAAAILAVAVLGAATGCSSTSAAGGDSSGGGFVAGDGSIVLLPEGQRVTAPDLVGTTLDGDTFRLADHRGEVVVFNVWASWCAPCRAEAPGLAAVALADGLDTPWAVRQLYYDCQEAQPRLASITNLTLILQGTADLICPKEAVQALKAKLPKSWLLYVWDAALGVTVRGTNITAEPGTDGYAPTVQNYMLVTDASRFVMAFGCNDYGSATQDQMLIRWSEQESLTVWYPAATNQAGSLRLSRGSQIVTALQSRQEILVFTDSSLYSLQYLGADPWWGSQILGDNISIIGENAAAIASGVTYWMGADKFYIYDGTVKTLKCDLRQFIYGDINLNQNEQVFAGTNEGFNEVWWFYCTAGSTVVNRYVVYNYLENVWYYGELGRTAWLDSGLSKYPLAATYSYNIVEHENGVDDNTTATTLPIEAYIASAEFDIDDGYKIGFVWRMLPDITFRGSSSASPSVTMYLRPMQNSGSGFNSPESVGGSASYPVDKTGTGTSYNIEEFTGQINTRVRGRQLVMEVRSTGLGVTWQLGSPRIDIRPDGRR